MLKSDWFFFSTVGLILVLGFALIGLINHANNGERSYAAAIEAIDCHRIPALVRVVDIRGTEGDSENWKALVERTALYQLMMTMPS